MKKCSCKKPLKEGTLDNGQPNIIDYADKNPLLFSLQDKVISNDYPGKIITGNEPSRESPDRTPKHGPSAATGKYAVGANRSEPTLPTGAPLEFKKLSFNNEVNDITEQLRKGIKVEREHTDNDLIAAKIAMDHLKENPRYYDYLTTMEDQMKKDMQETVSIPGTLVMRKISLKEDHLPGGDEEELKEGVWNEQDHPRAPAGTSQGGQFVSKDGGYTPSSEPDYGIKDPQKDVKTMYPHELDKQIKYWEDTIKFETDEDDKALMLARLRELKEEWNNQVDKLGLPGTKYKLEDEKDQEPKTKSPFASTKEMYDYHLQQTGDSNADRDKRDQYWKDSEEMNMRIGQLHGEIGDLKSSIMLDEMLLKQENQSEQTKQMRKAAMERDIAKLEEKEAERRRLTDWLQPANKLEAYEVQRQLAYLKSIEDDQKRRKKGSMPYMQNEMRMRRIRDEIDNYRTNKASSRTLEEIEAENKQRRSDREIRNEELRKQREQENAESEKQFKGIRDKAYDVLKSHGINPDKTDVGSPQVYDQLKGLKPGSPKENLGAWEKMSDAEKLKTHSEYIENLDKYNKANFAWEVVKAEWHRQSWGGGDWTSLQKQRLKKAQWKAENLVKDHPVVGVAVYSDATADRTKAHLDVLAKADKWSSELIKHVEIHQGAGESFRMAGGRRGKAAGVWMVEGNPLDGDDRGTVKLWYNGAKWEKGLFEADELNTVPHHEYAHAKYDAIENFVKRNPIEKSTDATYERDIAIKNAFLEFNFVANQTGFAKYKTSEGDEKQFSLNAYTDSYYKSRDDRANTETHSKLAEWEASGQMEKEWNDIQELKQLAATLPPEDKEHLDEVAMGRYGHWNFQHALDMEKLIIAWGKLQDVTRKYGPR